MNVSAIGSTGGNYPVASANANESSIVGDYMQIPISGNLRLAKQKLFASAEAAGYTLEGNPFIGGRENKFLVVRLAPPSNEMTFDPEEPEVTEEAPGNKPVTQGKLPGSYYLDGTRVAYPERDVNHDPALLVNYAPDRNGRPVMGSYVLDNTLFEFPVDGPPRTVPSKPEISYFDPTKAQTEELLALVDALPAPNEMTFTEAEGLDLGKKDDPA
ncbi:MAG: hypothetical protein WCV91_03310 [Candidatus Margulisiibacteriota bacterium]